MAFAQNLLEGFAQAAGDEPTVARIEGEKANQRGLAHEELAAQTQSILNDVTGLQQRRASLDPSSPTYQKDIADIDANLHKARQTFTDLYHPEKNPDALQHLGSFLKQHIGRRQQQAPPKTAGQAKESMASTIAGLDIAAAGGLDRTLKPLSGSKPYKGSDGRWYQSMVGPDGTIKAQPMPEGY